MIFTGLYSAFSMGQSAAPALPKDGKLMFQVDSVSFTDSVVLAKLKNQKTAWVMRFTNGSFIKDTGFRILHYTCTILSKVNGFEDINIYSNSLRFAASLFDKLSPGDFIMFSEIRVKGPDGKALYLDNVSGLVK